MRRHHYLRTVLAIICFGISVAGIAYLVGTYHFYKTHFNTNVSINGVDVGKMSERKAYNTVNALGNNWMVLRDGKIHESHYKNSGEFITMKDIRRYHTQQYETFGSDKTWNFAPRNLSRDRKKLDKLNRETVTYRINGHDYKLKATDMFDVVHYADGQYHFDEDEGFNQEFDKISDKEETLNKQYQITDPDGKPVKVKNQSYGWEIDQEATENAIKQAFIHNTGFVDGSNYIRGVGYTTKGTGYGVKDNHGLGKDFVVVSIDQQKLWVYKDNQPVVTLDDVVTGTADPKADDATPKGVWYIMYKQSPSILRGKNNDGTKYASKVQYWMPFTQTGCGLHDASWRTNWNKDAYKEGGSHGCVNIKPSEIKQVWDNTYQNEPVIVY